MFYEEIVRQIQKIKCDLSECCAGIDAGGDTDWVQELAKKYVYNNTDSIGIGTTTPRTNMDFVGDLLVEYEPGVNGTYYIGNSGTFLNEALSLVLEGVGFAYTGPSGGDDILGLGVMYGGQGQDIGFQVAGSNVTNISGWSMTCDLGVNSTIGLQTNINSTQFGVIKSRNHRVWLQSNNQGTLSMLAEIDAIEGSGNHGFRINQNGDYFFHAGLAGGNPEPYVSFGDYGGNYNGSYITLNDNSEELRISCSAVYIEAADLIGVENTVQTAGAGAVVLTTPAKRKHVLLKTGITAGGDNITLPTGVSMRQGQEIVIKDDGGNLSVGNPINLITPGAETIDNLASVTMITPNMSLTLLFDGTNYKII